MHSQIWRPHVNHYLTSNLHVQYLWPSILQLILTLLSLSSCLSSPTSFQWAFNMVTSLFISTTIKSLQLNFVKSSSSSYFVTYHSNNPLQLVFAPILKTNRSIRDVSQSPIFWLPVLWKFPLCCWFSYFTSECFLAVPPMTKCLFPRDLCLVSSSVQISWCTSRFECHLSFDCHILLSIW